MIGLLTGLGVIGAACLCIAAVPLLARRMPDTIFLVVPMNALADVLIEYSSIAGVHSGHMRAIVLATIVAVAFPRIRWDAANTIVFGLLTYLLPLVVLSSDLAVSFDVYLKFSLALLMIPLAQTRIRSLADLAKLHRSVLVGIAVFVVAFVVFQVFKLGTYIYYEDSIYFAGGQAKFLKFLAYAVLLAPMMAYASNDRVHVRATSMLAALICMVLVFQRTPLLAVILGYGVFYMLGVARTKMVRNSLVACGATAVFLFGIAPRYGEMVVTVAERRLGVQREVQSQGGRVEETRFVLTAVQEAGPVQLLVGKELFNGGMLTGIRKSDGRWRPVHIDFNILLLGSGVIGLALYLSMYASIGRTLWRRARYAPSAAFGRTVRATTCALLVACLVMSIGNQLWGLTPLGLLCMYLGALLGVSRDWHRQRADAVALLPHLESPLVVTSAPWAASAAMDISGEEAAHQ